MYSELFKSVNLQRFLSVVISAISTSCTFIKNAPKKPGKEIKHNIFLFISFFLQNIFLSKGKFVMNKLIKKQGTKNDKSETFELVMLILF